MIRIRGRVGNCPVELEIELDAQDWALLGAALSPVAAAAVVDEETPAAVAARPSPSGSPFWEQAKQLVQSAQALSGPELLVQLEALCGNVQQAKQLMVRLRHTAEIVVERGPDALLYRWQG